MRQITKPNPSADPINGEYDVDLKKIYGSYDRDFNNIFIIKKLDEGLWHGVVLGRTEYRWNEGYETLEDALNGLLKWDSVEVWEFDSTTEFLEWSLEKIKG